MLNWSSEHKFTPRRKAEKMNWKLDTFNLYIWNLENSPFGIEKIDKGVYLPFRLWGKARVYVRKDNENLVFSTRQQAMKYTEGAYKVYLSKVIEVK